MDIIYHDILHQPCTKISSESLRASSPVQQPSLNASNGVTDCFEIMFSDEILLDERCVHICIFRFKCFQKLSVFISLYAMIEKEELSIFATQYLLL